MRIAVMKRGEGIFSNIPNSDIRKQLSGLARSNGHESLAIDFVDHDGLKPLAEQHKIDLVVTDDFRHAGEISEGNFNGVRGPKVPVLLCSLHATETPLINDNMNVTPFDDFATLIRGSGSVFAQLASLPTTVVDSTADVALGSGKGTARTQ